MNNQPQVATVVFTLRYTVKVPYRDIPDLSEKLNEFDIAVPEDPDPDTYIINAVKDSNGQPIDVDYLDCRPIDPLARLILETNESLAS